MSTPEDGRPRRLFRILRMLRERPWGLHEIGAELQVSAPQLRRDLALLREVIAEDGFILREEGAGRRQKQVWIEGRGSE